MMGKLGDGRDGVVLKAMWKSKNIMVAVKKLGTTNAAIIHKEVGNLIHVIILLIECLLISGCNYEIGEA